MKIPDNIKNRILKLTLYTNMTSKGIINVISSDIPISIEDYCNILEEYEKNTGKKITRNNKNNEALKKIEDELLIELCQKGWSNIIILNYLLDNGYVIALGDLKVRLNELYKNYNLGKRETIAKKKYSRRSGISDEEIMALFNKGVTFVEMAKYFGKIGKKVTPQRLNMIVHEIYKKNGKVAPKRNKFVKENETKKEPKKKKIGESEQKIIYHLRQQCYSYEEMAYYFQNKGYKVSASAVRVLCKKIYERKGETEPKLNRSLPSFWTKKIYELKEKGMTYKEIEEYFKIRGTKLSHAFIQTRCQEAYRTKEKRIPTKLVIQDNNENMTINIEYIEIEIK